MSLVAPGVAIVQIVECCSRHGSDFLELCQNLRTGDVRIEQVVTQIQSHWLCTSVQLELLHHVWETLDREHQSILSQILQILVDKLNTANANIGRIAAKEQRVGNPNDASVMKKYTRLRLRENLDKTLEELRAWEETLNMSWFLIMKIADPIIDEQLFATLQQAVVNQAPSTRELLYSAQRLRNALLDTSSSSFPKSLFLPYDCLNTARVIEVPFTSVKLTQRKGSEEWMILDSIPIPSGVHVPQLTKCVQELVGKLHYADPDTFGLLNCYGAVKVPHPIYPSRLRCFYTVFKVPRDMSEPSTLRGRLAGSFATDNSLSDRFKIAKELARSVCSIHTLGFVHRNIRPETVLLLRSKPLTLGSAFLVGFENARLSGSQTLQSGDTHWERNLYKHPHWVGLHPKDDDIMQQDIYSLGVCLLELGLWQSFVTYDEHGANPSPAPVLKNMAKSSNGNQLSMKACMLNLARKDLPKRMGATYARVVESCLTCLDKNNMDFEGEEDFKDKEGVLVAVRFIEKIVLQLDSISV